MSFLKKRLSSWWWEIPVQNARIAAHRPRTIFSDLIVSTTTGGYCTAYNTNAEKRVYGKYLDEHLSKITIFFSAVYFGAIFAGAIFAWCVCVPLGFGEIYVLEKSSL